MVSFLTHIWKINELGVSSGLNLIFPALCMKIGITSPIFHGCFMRKKSTTQKIDEAFQVTPVVAILGPRQVGKTTAARHYFGQQQGAPSTYFDLENPQDLLRLQDPMLALEDTTGLIVIDEIQRSPELFSVLRVLVDQKKERRFLILGSASRELIAQSSESLAGRISYLELTPFSFEDTQTLTPLWLRGGFPLSYLADTDQHSMAWRQSYIKTFLEQDIPNLGITIPAQNLRRFWTMIAHYHGQVFNASELGNSLDLNHKTVKKYLDILTGTFMMRELQPWHENIGKRLVKSSKVYFRDTGIYHALLGIDNNDTLLTHPKLGASWEGFALESVIRHLDAEPQDCYFWRTHNQAELDLLITQGTKRLGFEFKHSKTIKVTRSMTIAMEDLKLDSLTVIHPGDVAFKLTREINCVPLKAFLSFND